MRPEFLKVRIESYKLQDDSYEVYVETIIDNELYIHQNIYPKTDLTNIPSTIIQEACSKLLQKINMDPPVARERRLRLV